jgi:hypothetical protein
LFAQIKKVLRNVDTLDLSLCYKITDKGIEHIFFSQIKSETDEKCNITKIYLDGCDNLTDTCFVKLKDDLKNVKFISLPRCSKFTQKTFDIFKNSGSVVHY